MIDGELPEPHRAILRRHLASCTSCRAFAEEVERWDLTLSREGVFPRISAGFDARLRAAMEASPAASAAELSERKRELQREYEDGMRRIESGWRTPSRLLELFGISLVVGLTLHLLWAQVGDLLTASGEWEGGGLLAMAIALGALVAAGWISAQMLVFSTRRFQQGPVLV